MANYKTPGVYIEEISSNPGQVASVATAVPAFIGYTEKANGIAGNSLTNHPFPISSEAEFYQHFGGAPVIQYSLQDQDPADTSQAPIQTIDSNGNPHKFVLKSDGPEYLLYWAIRHFFQNDGKRCYVVSVGGYSDQNGALINVAELENGLDTLSNEREPTIIVIPEAVRLAENDCYRLQTKALKHCGIQMKNRVTILDVWGGDQPRNSPGGDCIENFRNGLGADALAYGVAYFPWVKTNVVQRSEVTQNSISISSRELLASLHQDGQTAETQASGITGAFTTSQPPTMKRLQTPRTGFGKRANRLRRTAVPTRYTQPTVGNAQSMGDALNAVMTAIHERLNLIPPSAGMAGVYTLVDDTRGVWKAPANVPIANVTAPAVNISNDEQSDLNTHTQGKSINAIRSFDGRGILVWGARTLDGNNPEWRYVNVRRTVIMLEESIQRAMQAWVFEPNEPQTWAKLDQVTSNFLMDLWKKGAFAGAKAEEAFSVRTGLGQTMTAQDIRDGVLRLEVGIAITRPAEFIVFTIEQKMQT